MKDFVKGMDFYRNDDPEGYHKTYGITVSGHVNQVEVYGDEGLRDRILSYLQTQEKFEAWLDAHARTYEEILNPKRRA